MPRTVIMHELHARRYAALFGGVALARQEKGAEEALVASLLPFLEASHAAGGGGGSSSSKAGANVAMQKRVSPVFVPQGTAAAQAAQGMAGLANEIWGWW